MRPLPVVAADSTGRSCRRHASRCSTRSGPKASPRGCATQKRVLLTDTTMRDAHQSLLATRMRTLRHRRHRRHLCARRCRSCLSLECWGGATFDVAMRFLNEDPWERLALLRETGAEHPAADAAARRQRRRLHQLSRQRRALLRRARRRSGGIDVFRIFDCLNWVENMRVAIDAVRRAGKLCEGGDLLHRRHPRPGAGQVRPQLLRRPRQGAGSGRRPHPRHQGHGRAAEAGGRARAGQGAARGDRPADPFPHPRHVGHAAASVLAAVEAGVDAVDAAMDAMSGLTSQPSLGSLVEALRRHQRDSGPRSGVRSASISLLLGSGARRSMRAFESDLQGPALGGLSARDARRPVHQPEGAGALARARDPLARGGAGLSRRQRCSATSSR